MLRYVESVILQQEREGEDTLEEQRDLADQFNGIPGQEAGGGVLLSGRQLRNTKEKGWEGRT
jgi:hypothetical protein